MRRTISAIMALAALAATTVTAFAENAEGKIKSIDADAFVITLDDGKRYKLPGEFDITAITKNMTVLIAYDSVNGENQITDMDLSE